MPRYIDADALIEEIKDELWDWQALDDITATCVLKQTITDIQNAPTADVVERKKGRWNTDKESPEYATCSVCGHCDWDCTESEYFKYCPNCGAQMGSE